MTLLHRLRTWRDANVWPWREIAGLWVRHDRDGLLYAAMERHSADVRAQLAAVTAERDALKSSIASGRYMTRNPSTGRFERVTG